MTPYAKTPPTEPGWYWWRNMQGRQDLVEIVNGRGGNMLLENSGRSIHDIRGEWGPRIPTPVQCAEFWSKETSK